MVKLKFKGINKERKEKKMDFATSAHFNAIFFQVQKCLN